MAGQHDTQKTEDKGLRLATMYRWTQWLRGVGNYGIINGERFTGKINGMICGKKKAELETTIKSVKFPGIYKPPPLGILPSLHPLPGLSQPCC